MATEDKKEYRHRQHRKHFLIPAGRPRWVFALIGIFLIIIGIGILRAPDR
jgi:uncharacterized membrane protein HdeD (DUF308 family)